MPEASLFAPVDLLERMNFKNVVDSLHALASVAVDIGFEPVLKSKLGSLNATYDQVRTVSVTQSR